MRSHDDDKSQHLETALVEECEAFLGGTFAERFARDARRLPSWVWLNAPAHRSSEELERVADQRGQRSDGGGKGDRWESAQGLLAYEVLCTAARTGLDTAEVQQRALVPLELELAATPARVGDLLPVVRQALVRLVDLRGKRPP